MTAQFLGLPTWLLYRALRPWLPAEHPWKDPLTLSTWAQGMTPLCRRLSAGLWISGLVCLTIWLWVVIAWGTP